MKNTEISTEIEESIAASRSIVRAATGSEAKAIANSLRRFGKRCRDKYIYSLGEEQLTMRLNFLETWKIFLAGWYDAYPVGAEVLATECEVFLSKLRRSSRLKVVKPIHLLPNPIMSEVEKTMIQIKSLASHIQDVCVMEAI